MAHWHMGEIRILGLFFFFFGKDKLNIPEVQPSNDQVTNWGTETDKTLSNYQHNEQARAALTFSSKKPTRQDGRKPEAPQPEEQEHTQDETSTPRQQGSWPRLCAVFVRGQN